MIEKINLPYPINALEPYYSKETLLIHFDILYTGYWLYLQETKRFKLPWLWHDKGLAFLFERRHW